jgi:hypothetical protein
VTTRPRTPSRADSYPDSEVDRPREDGGNSIAIVSTVAGDRCSTAPKCPSTESCLDRRKRGRRERFSLRAPDPLARLA